MDRLAKKTKYILIILITGILLVVSGCIFSIQKPFISSEKIPVSFSALPDTGSCLYTADFNVDHSWDSQYTAAWGGAPTWELTDESGDNSNPLYAPPLLRSNYVPGTMGSSTKVDHITNLKKNTDYNISGVIKVPITCRDHWVELAYILEEDAPESHVEVVDGLASGKHFDDDGSIPGTHPNGNTSALWTLVKKFAWEGSYERNNGGHLVKYDIDFNSGNSTKISIGIKHGNTGACEDVMWDDIKLCEAGDEPTPIPSPTTTITGGGECVTNLQATCSAGNVTFNWTNIGSASQYILRADHDSANTAQCVNSVTSKNVGWYCPASSNCLTTSCDDKYIQFSADHTQSMVTKTTTVLAGQNYNWYVEVLKTDGSKCSTTATQVLNCGSSTGSAICGPMDTDGNNTLDLVDFAKFASIYRKTCSSTSGQTSTCGSQDVAPSNGVIDLIDFNSIASRYRKPSCAL